MNSLPEMWRTRLEPTYTSSRRRPARHSPTQEQVSRNPTSVDALQSAKHARHSREVCATKREDEKKQKPEDAPGGPRNAEPDIPNAMGVGKRLDEHGNSGDRYE